jgi:hypothetical protein
LGYVLGIKCAGSDYCVFIAVNSVYRGSNVLEAGLLSFGLDAGSYDYQSVYPEGTVTGRLDTHVISRFSMCTTANAGMVLDSSKLPLHASHVALPNCTLRQSTCTVRACIM